MKLTKINDMTAKEKAEELVLRYLRIDNNTKEWFNKHIAKQCALIAVEEIINSIDAEDHVILYFYWQKVKTEIENL
jgi:hypothetical protein